ncbi:MAG: dihydrofolate reductase [bacterium]|nr:dihydrofolate reductase [bacterium]
MAQEAEKISIAVAIGRDQQHNRVIGCKGDLLWHIPDDLKRFKALTLGHPVIMGRRTWESLPEKVRPLPGRTNIVVTRDNDYRAQGALIAHSFPEAISLARNAEGASEIFVAGGTEIYQCALPFTTNLYLTVIDDEKEGDAFFPAYEGEFPKETAREEREWNGLNYSWVDLER